MMHNSHRESDNIEDLEPGVIVSVDPETAEKLGAFEETALTDEEAESSILDYEA